MKVWITRYALSSGIINCEAELCNTNGGMIKCELGYFHGDGKEWCSTEDGAVLRAEEMRKAKIVSLKKSIAKIETLKFSCKDEK